MGKLIFSNNKQSLRRVSSALGFVLFFTVGFAQNFTCNDSITTALHFSSAFSSNVNFQNISTKDANSIIFQTYPNGAQVSLFAYKFTETGSPIWAKQINQNKSVPWNDIKEMDDGNLIFDSKPYSPFLGSVASNHIILDSAGNFLWQGNYNNQNGDTGIQVVNSGGPGTILWAGSQLSSNGGGLIVERFDYVNQMENWTGIYQVNNPGKYQIKCIDIAYLNGLIYLAGVYSSTMAGISNPGVWILQIDYNTGNILKSAAFDWVNPGAAGDIISVSGQGSFKVQNSSLLRLSFNLYDQTSNSYEIGFSTFDLGLKSVGNTLLLRTALSGFYPPFSLINRSGNSLFVTSNNSGLAYLAELDSVSRLSRQFKLAYSNSWGSSSSAYNLNDFNSINAAYSIVQGANSGFGFSTIPDGFQNEGSCVSVIDTTFVNPIESGLSPSSLAFFRTASLPKVSIASPSIMPLSIFTVNVKTYCKVPSICNAIKLVGQSKCCFGDSIFAFSAIKNTECMKSIVWTFDSTMVSGTTMSGDTAMTLKFKQPGKTTLRVTLSGCQAQDSFPITIQGPSNIRLTGDSQICAQITDTLKASGGFHNYLWQDGSVDSIYLASLPGIYQVSGQDLCNNSSTDSINVKTLQEQLLSLHSLTICKNIDTTLSAQSGFLDYKWSTNPDFSASTNSQFFQIKVVNSQDYYVSATSIKGCYLADKISVTVKNCADYFRMPNAFTPNYDGQNDFIYPILRGNIASYEFMIFNRWGTQVFSSNQIGIGWNGKIHGITQSSGTFVWMCRFRFVGEPENIQRGTFVLIN